MRGGIAASSPCIACILSIAAVRIGGTLRCSMSFDQLQTVIAVAEEGTVVRAARRLCLTQPPVSRRLLALEDELGVALFARTSRGMVPTPAGTVLLAHARTIVEAIEVARRAVTDRPTPGPTTAETDASPPREPSD